MDRSDDVVIDRNSVHVVGVMTIQISTPVLINAAVSHCPFTSRIDSIEHTHRYHWGYKLAQDRDERLFFGVLETSLV